MDRISDALVAAVVPLNKYSKIIELNPDCLIRLVVCVKQIIVLSGCMETTRGCLATKWLRI